MTYRYMLAGQTVNNKTPKTTYTELVQNTLNDQFYNASNVFTIEQETFLTSGVYENVDARITNVVNAGVGDNVEMDFKKIYFKNLNHPVNLGRMYKFDDNYWITTNVDKIKTLAQTIIVRRCNNRLRWIDSDGSLYEVPCALGYAIEENRDYSTAGSALVVPSGILRCTAQLNQYTNKIKPNQRFLFGNPNNWTSYRVEGGGINNFNNQTTDDNATSGILKLTLSVDFVNLQVDDTTNGIANSLENIYVITLNQASISGDSGQSVQLRNTVTLNGVSVSRDVVWLSSNTAIATVSNTGLVTFVSSGTCVITCSLSGNSLVSDTCAVTVSGTPVDNYQVVFSPDRNSVYEGETVTYSVYLYKNNVQQADAITFSLNANTVTSDSYTYTVIGANSFSVKNLKKFLTDSINITATSGIYNADLNIKLIGGW